MDVANDVVDGEVRLCLLADAAGALKLSADERLIIGDPVPPALPDFVGVAGPPSI